MNKEMESYSTQIEVNASPEDVYKVVNAGIDKWWTTSSNSIEKVGDKLIVRFGDAAYKVIVVSKMVPNELICWKVEEANINHKDISKKDEWVGTEIIWKIEESSIGSKVKFTHNGLVPLLECYEVCKGGWGYFLGSLKSYLDTGQGTPYVE